MFNGVTLDVSRDVGFPQVLVLEACVLDGVFEWLGSRGCLSSCIGVSCWLRFSSWVV